MIQRNILDEAWKIEFNSMWGGIFFGASATQFFYANSLAGFILSAALFGICTLFVGISGRARKELEDYLDRN